MAKLGWFSSGRDRAARLLLKTVFKGVEQGELAGEISFVFSSREYGENKESDAFLNLVKKLNLPLLSFSAKKFEPKLWQKNRPEWRQLYHQKVEELIAAYDFDFIVLAGYMLIVSPEMCRKYVMINLHPALPGGPAGTWQDVIWQIIKARSKEHGAMMHLVSEELDKGPPLTYFSFSLKTPKFLPLWKVLENKLEKAGSFEDLLKKEGEKLSLFKEIREEGVKRELPLIYFTIKRLLIERIEIKRGQVFLGGEPLTEAVCLNEEVEEWLRERAQ